MKTKSIISALALTSLLGACSSVTTTRGLPLEQLPTASNNLATSIKSTQNLAWRVEDVRVTVPDTLTVTEANSYIPHADIVWRGDPYGDRREQVKNIVDLAVSQAAIGLEGVEPVYLDIELVKFHALSQKARATVGGVHNIKFNVGIRDVATNEFLVDRFPVEIKLKALGGQKAIDAEMRGETQKLRITREIASVMRLYLGT